MAQRTSGSEIHWFRIDGAKISGDWGLKKMGTSVLPVGSVRPVRDKEWSDFWEWCLPQLGLAWHGYRRIHRRIQRRIDHRLAETAIPNLSAYRSIVTADPAELDCLDQLLRVTISRFFRDLGVFEELAMGVLPYLTMLAPEQIRCWSAGCASGEEAYSLRILWDLSLQKLNPGTSLSLVATDVDAQMIARAQAARYPQSSLKEIPREWQRVSFENHGREARLSPRFQHDVEFQVQDLRDESPSGTFDLILCRNLAFTYFATDLQNSVLKRLSDSLEPGGFLVVGAHEVIPEPWRHALRKVSPCLYQKNATETIPPYQSRPAMRSWLRRAAHLS